MCLRRLCLPCRACSYSCGSLVFRVLRGVMLFQPLLLNRNRRRRPRTGVEWIQGLSRLLRVRCGGVTPLCIVGVRRVAQKIQRFSPRVPTPLSRAAIWPARLRAEKAGLHKSRGKRYTFFCLILYAQSTGATGATGLVRREGVAAKPGSNTYKVCTYLSPQSRFTCSPFSSINGHVY